MYVSDRILNEKKPKHIPRIIHDQRFKEKIKHKQNYCDNYVMINSMITLVTVDELQIYTITWLCCQMLKTLHSGPRGCGFKGRSPTSS